MPAPQAKAKKKRSRGGCTSCKRLRIKCSEDKPICEYCYHTNRQCEYPSFKSSDIELKITKPSPESTHSARLSPFSSLSPAISTSTWSSQSDQELSEDVKRITKGPALHEELTRDLVLTQSTSMLGISRFELRLLQFFDKECTTLLAFGIPTIENAWKYGVPGLFLESELTRSAIFSFSAMTLLSMVDLNLALQTDAAEDERSLARSYNIDVNNPNNMFTQSISYFMDTISKKKSLLDQADSPSFQDPKIAKELTVASILIFSYLALDPNRLIPVIDFTRESTDLVQVARGVRHTILHCVPIVQKSDIAEILFFRGIERMNPPSFKSCDYAVIVSLREELYDLVTNEVSSRTAEEHSVLQESIYSLIHCIYGCEFFEFPVPLFRFMMKISDEFKDLLYARNPFSLKILYRYSSLNAISGFYYHESRNVWKDYMIWYAKRYEMAEIDRQLYYLAVQKNYKWEDHTKFQEFDPAVEYDKLRRLDGAQ